MSPDRNIQTYLASHPLTARSVIASTLLGTPGLALPAQALVRAGELFGIAEGATRVALSRMTVTGELIAGPGRYRLGGPLVSRSAAQKAGRHARRQSWQGDWQMAVVTAERRAPADRAALRTALARLHLASWREGVWLRPDNLGPPSRLPDAAHVVSEQCAWVTARVGADRALAARLWDLKAWATQAERLRVAMADSIGDLESGDISVLRSCFLVAAAVVRHLSADPLLPVELLPGRWPGEVTREQYDHYEAALQGLLREWFRT